MTPSPEKDLTAVNQPLLKRPVVLDASNIGYNHAVTYHNLKSRDPRFLSARGILYGIKQFLDRGHQVRTFVPLHFSKKSDVQNPEIFEALARLQLLSFTPARRFTKPSDNGTSPSQGPRNSPDVNSIPGVVNYDDLFLFQYAHRTGGCVISNDRFADVLQSHPEWRGTIAQRTLRFSWKKNTIVFKGVLGTHVRDEGLANEALFCFPTDPTYALVKDYQLEPDDAAYLIGEIDKLLQATANTPVPSVGLITRKDTVSAEPQQTSNETRIARFCFREALKNEEKTSEERRSAEEEETERNRLLLEELLSPPVTIHIPKETKNRRRKLFNLSGMD